ncbi:MAG: hypothetical protein NUV49_03050, partial [Patescibacteria group bacterium]|nr:hypothetical protein [Patescibacteria group bacterium]
ITVTNGLFSVLLGSSTPLTSVDFNQTLYLEVLVGGTASSTMETLSPRKKLGAVPAAFEAGKLDGVDSTSFVRSDEADTIAATSASTLLTINQSGAGDILNLLDGGNEVFTVVDGGNIGVGTTSPYAKLSVVGQTVSEYFTATSSTASQFPYASSTAITVSGTASTSNLIASNNFTFKTVTGFLKATAGAVATALVDLTTDITGTLGVGNGGTGATTFTSSQLLYGNGTNALSSVATTTLSLGTGFTYSGTLGSLVGGANGTLSLSGVVPSSLSLTKGYFIVGDDAGTAQATSSVFISSTGRVGIGTTTPARALDVTSSGPVLADFYSTGNTVSIVDISNTSATGLSFNRYTLNNNNAWSVGIDGSDSNKFKISQSYDSTLNTARLTIDTAGNIGVGTTTPWAKLSVSSTAGGTTPLFTVASSTSGAGTTTAFHITSDGYVIVGSTTPITGFGGDALLSAQSNVDAIRRIDVKNYGTGTLARAGVIARSDLASLVLDVFSSTNTQGFGSLEAALPAAARNLAKIAGVDSSALFIGLEGTTTPIIFGSQDNGARMFINNVTGNVGIGTTSPDVRLVVQDTTPEIKLLPSGDVSQYTRLFHSNYWAGPSTQLISRSGGVIRSLLARYGDDLSIMPEGGNVGIGTTSPYAKLSVSSTAGGTTPLFTVASSTSGAGTTTAFHITAQGNVGIGTAAPSTTLDINGDTTIAGNISFINADRSIFTSGYSTKLLLDASAVVLQSASGGNVGIGTTTPGTLLSLGNTGNDTINISGTATSTFGSGINVRTGCFAVNGVCVGGAGGGGSGTVGSGTTGQLPYYAGSGTTLTATSSLFLATSGYVGIGTSTPAQKLTVAGNILLDGTSGQSIYSTRSGGTKQLLLSTNSDGTNNFYGYGDSLAITAVNGATYFHASDGSGSIMTLLAGKVGIGTTSPYAKFSVVNTTGGTTPLFTVASSTSGAGTTTAFHITSQGNVGIGKSNPTAKLDIEATDGNHFQFTQGATAIWNGGAYSDSSFRINESGASVRFLIATGGNVGIGTTSPYAKLSVVGEAVARNFTATSTTATSTFAGGLNINSGALLYDYGANKTSIENLDLGPVNFEPNAGIVSWIDLSVTSSAPLGTDEAYAAQLDSNRLLTIAGESNGAGGIRNTGVHIGTSTVLYSTNIPWNSLIVGDGILCVDNGGDNCDDSARTRGTIYANNATVSGLDLAEEYPTKDSTLGAGDIVMLDANNPVFVRKYDRNPTVVVSKSRKGKSEESATTTKEINSPAAPQRTPQVFGVVSTEPGLLLGGFDSQKYKNERRVPLALAGRVPVKVTMEGGPIAIGDRIAPSAKVAGAGKKSSGLGSTIGIALESFTAGSPQDESGRGTILVFVDLASQGLSGAIAQGDMEFEFGEKGIFDLGGRDIANARSIISESGTWSISADGTLIAENLTVKGTAKIGSPERRTGITLYDEETGAPYCLTISGGLAKTTPAECVDSGTGESAQSATVIDATIPESPPEPATTTPEPPVVSDEPATSTPETTAPDPESEPAPELEPEPEPEQEPVPEPEPAPEPELPVLEETEEEPPAEETVATSATTTPAQP